jgi:protein disulfide-isomerase A1
VASLTLIGGSYVEEDDVLVLTNDNFDQALSEFPAVLVEFYAPWCGHCKALAPEYAKAANTLKEEGSPIRLAKVDATVQKELAEKNKIKGYPTIKLFRQGVTEPAEFTAGRFAADIVGWLKRKTGTPATIVDNVQQAKQLIEDNEVVVFAFFKSDVDEVTKKQFLDFADSKENLPFAITESDAVFTEYKVSGSSVVVFKKFDEFQVDLPVADMTSEKLAEFVKINELPLVVEFTQEKAERIFEDNRKNHLLLFVSKNSSDFDSLLDTFKQAAPEFRGKVLFMYIDINDDDNLQVLEFFGMKVSDCPALRFIQLDDDMLKYRPASTELTVTAMKQFVQGVLDGTIKPHLMSEPVPEDWDANPVKVLVGENFDSVAKDKSKSVIVKFYAPWCGHCKKLAPIWDELGEKYKDSSDIVVAKLDATSNELEDRRIESFPTVLLFPKNSDEMITYNGKRTLEAFVNFIESGGKVIETESKKEPEAEEKEATKEEL